MAILFNLFGSEHMHTRKSDKSQNFELYFCSIPIAAVGRWPNQTYIQDPKIFTVG